MDRTDDRHRRVRDNHHCLFIGVDGSCARAISPDNCQIDVFSCVHFAVCLALVADYPACGLPVGNGANPDNRGKPGQRPFKPWDYIFDPLRKNSRRFYVMSVGRRRLETVLLLLMLILAAVMAYLALCRIRAELVGLTACSGTCAQTSFNIVISEFAESEDSFIENSLHDSLSGELDRSFFVCRTPQPISIRSVAKEFAGRANANVVIWGRMDRQAYEVNMEVGLDPTKVAGLRLSYQPTPEPGDFYFQDLEVSHLSFLTQFIVSEALYEAGDKEKAFQKLHVALSHAEREGLASVDFAQGYLL